MKSGYNERVKRLTFRVFWWWKIYSGRGRLGHKLLSVQCDPTDFNTKRTILPPRTKKAAFTTKKKSVAQFQHLANPDLIVPYLLYLFSLSNFAQCAFS